ncbi:MAG: thioredoxin domain-containing protein [Phycisphaeraceae bacterium]
MKRISRIKLTYWLVILCAVAGALVYRLWPVPQAVVIADAKSADGRYKYTNRLANEKSPYLLQHAHNPVNWYPWGKEAFEKAKKDNKPIFLSIGYSTCHWCHVMEEESFSNPEIAKLMNDNFVSIKVDREERPDVDRVYMKFVVASTGSGGWPMTVLLTPDLKPFWGGTYFPPDAKYGMPGLKQIIPQIAQAWQKDREKVVASANDITQQLQKMVAVASEAGAALEKGALAKGYQQLTAGFDERLGGFGSAPKFPQPVNLNFLLHYQHRTGEKQALEMVLTTLRQMAWGGMHDQLGGGFHRYSTDERWFLPHFEKMLYDQAQLASVYLDAYQITKDEFYANVARDILNYVLRDMTGKDGQFYSAEDADSVVDPAHPEKKAEGAFYVWSSEEIRKTLDERSAKVFSYYYGVENNGNVARDPHNEFPNKNVLYVAHSAEEAAEKLKLSKQEVESILADARAKMLKARDAHPRPHLDDKTIVAWNGLMISPLARAGVILGEPHYTEAAAKAADFIRANLYDQDAHTLTRVWREGRSDINGFLSDYAFFIHGLLDLYETTLDIRWLKLALDLQAKQDALFWDAQAGGYFDTTGTDPSVLLRMKEDSDNAEPSANSIAALNLLRLSQMTDSRELRDKAEKTLRAFAGRLSNYPAAMPQMLVAFDFHLDKPKQIVLAGKPGAPDTRAMLKEIYARYIPNKIILSADGGQGQKLLAQRVTFLQSVAPINGRATAFVCENYVCKLPTNEPPKLAAVLDSPAQKRE